MSNRSGSSRTHAPGLLLLGACTLWLVVQNTLLALTFLWIEPRKATTLLTMLGKAALALISGFWTSPAAPLMIGVVLVVGLAAPILIGWSANREVIHG